MGEPARKKGNRGATRLAPLLALAGALAAAGCSDVPLLYEGRGDLEVEPLEVRLIRVTDTGLEPPATIRLTEDDGGLAFINDTHDRPISVVFPDHAIGHIRCSYTKGFDTDGRSTFTLRPLPPGGVASICLHAAGRIAFEVHGAGPAPFKGALELTPAPHDERKPTGEAKP